jgi:flagellar basal-body rod modification protein FlgD
MYVTNAIAGGAATHSGASSNTGSTSPSLDTTFAQLLVAQLKSQDPLNPMDPTQFVSQLVGLNTLNAVTSIYQLLQGLATIGGQSAAASGPVKTGGN